MIKGDFSKDERDNDTNLRTSVDINAIITGRFHLTGELLSTVSHSALSEPFRVTTPTTARHRQIASNGLKTFDNPS